MESSLKAAAAFEMEKLLAISNKALRKKGFGKLKFSNGNDFVIPAKYRNVMDIKTTVLPNNAKNKNVLYGWNFSIREKSISFFFWLVVLGLIC